VKQEEAAAKRSRSELVAGTLLQLAPLLGFAIWFWLVRTHDLWDDVEDGPIALLIFVPGLFMVAAGLVFALAGCFVSGSAFVRAQAVASLRFHGIVAGMSLVLGAVLIVASGFDGGPHTLDHPPALTRTAFVLTILTFGAALTLVEVVRSLAAAAGALRTSGR
jgi:hypothetical protein